jgi:hypothetical protein
MPLKLGLPSEVRVGRDVVGALPDLVTASVSAEPTMADRTAIAIVFPMTSPHSAGF